MASELRYSIFFTNNENFEETVWRVFRFQSKNCSVYAQYLAALGLNAEKITSVNKIPFLPVSLFKNYTVLASGLPAQKIFTSSSTTGQGQSNHHVADISLYEESFLTGFRQFYGGPDDYCILALLPGYLERTGSSLVYMADRLIQLSGHADSGFYLYEHKKLADVIEANESVGQKTLVLGVSFALLDFAEQFHTPLKHTIIMETGGMKGRRKELTRAELHGELKTAWGLGAIHSEYGMTELLSQAYSKADGRFVCPSWMKVLTRSADDPFGYAPTGKTGGINVIDLANLYSCSFIETEDLGRLHPDGSFEVLGRMDFSEVRGCNTMVG
ncbi:MAG TPA: acyl transferase [Bacteroidia bacterium]|nr:acyl transferase [Bacteroidia bacterium]